MKGKKTGGRQKGVPNKVTVEARTYCASIVDDPTYQKRLRRRALAGTLPPQIEAMIWYYAKGKPTEHLEVGADDRLIELLKSARARVGDNQNPSSGAAGSRARVS